MEGTADDVSCSSFTNRVTHKSKFALSVNANMLNHKDAPGTAAGVPSLSEKLMISISYEKFTLSNGLDVILHEDHTLPMVAVNVWYHVGSKDEQVGKTGFAHLFEHVMFEGSKHHDKSFFEPLQKVGASLNGSTTTDRTNYWETIPSNYLALALWLEADRMGYLLDALDQKRFDVQRDVVKNERRQSYENRPYGMAHLLLQSAVFPTPHPYSWPVIGSMEDLNAATLDDVRSFFSHYYAPSNASLAIAGDFAPDEARRLVESYFGDIPPGAAISRVGRMESELSGRVSLTMRDKVQLPRLYLVWPTGPIFDSDEASLSMLSSVLGDGKSSRLYRSLVYEKQIARDVGVFHHAQEIAGEFHLQVTLNEGHSLDEAESVARDEIERILREPLNDEELARAKNRIQSAHVRQLERIGGFGGRADQLNYYNTLAGDPGAINTDLDRYNAVTIEDVRRVADSAISKDHVRLAVLPERPLKASAASIDRSVMPAAAASPHFTPPMPRRLRLSGGLDVVLVEKPGIPLVALGVLIRAGAVTDPTGRPGLAHVTAAMLPEGTSNRSSQRIAEEMEFLGSHLSVHPAREYLLVSSETLASHWEEALDIVADVVRNATFPDDELDRVRKRQLTDLRRVADSPVSIAARTSRALLYGPESQYGHPVTGLERVVEDISREELLAHYAAHYRPGNTTLIVVGDVKEADVVAKLEAAFGDWAVGGASPSTEHAPDDTPQPAGATIFIADKPGAAQSVIRAGHLVIPRHHPDYYSLNLLNYVLGGQFSARLNINLRQDKGYSYGYTSSIDWFAGPSSLLAGGGVQTAVTRESVIETIKEFTEIRGPRPVTREEFEDARDGIRRGLPGQFGTLAQIAQQLTRMIVFGLPDDYFATFLANLEAMTLEDINRVAAERLDESHLMILVVGDRQVIEPELSELGYPIIPVDYEGRRLSQA